MIAHIFRTKSDIENLSRKRTISLDNEKNPDFHGKIVKKPWGYEYLMYENTSVAIWVLHINKGSSTSMHCHPKKKTSLLVLSGKVRTSTLEGWLDREAGQGIIIDEAVFHSTTALSEKGVTVMEIETPPNKKDLVRLRDEYGREEKGYEGSDCLTTNFSDYEYIHFHDVSGNRKITKLIGECKLSVGICSSRSEVRTKIPSGYVLCLLDGSITGRKGNSVLLPGEVVAVDQLAKQEYKILTKIWYLSIQRVRTK